MSQEVREIIDRGIGRKAIARGHLCQQFTACGQEDNGDTTLTSDMLQVNKVFWPLKQPGTRLARRWQHQNDRLLLLTNYCKQALLFVRWLDIQQAEIAIFVEFHRDLFFSRRQVFPYTDI